MVCATMDAAGIPHAVIGAMAAAAHGFQRGTSDLDLLALDRACLLDATWSPVRATGASVSVRKGDIEDPLLGVVRITREGDVPIDVVIGYGAWQRAILERSVPLSLGDTETRVVTAPDLVLLKLYATAAPKPGDAPAPDPAGYALRTKPPDAGSSPRPAATS